MRKRCERNRRWQKGCEKVVGGREGVEGGESVSSNGRGWFPALYMPLSVFPIPENRCSATWNEIPGEIPDERPFSRKFSRVNRK